MLRAYTFSFWEHICWTSPNDSDHRLADNRITANSLFLVDESALDHGGKYLPNIEQTSPMIMPKRRSHRMSVA